MVAYTLPSATPVAPIRDGRRSILLAAPRRADARNGHAGPGARIHLRLASSSTSPFGKVLPTARCTVSALVTFSADGVVRVLESAVESRPHADRDAARRHGEGVANLLAQAEQASAGDRAGAAERLAVMAGFRSFGALWASLNKNEGEVIARHLIGWVLS